MYQYCLILDLLYDLGGYFDKKAGILAKYPPKRVNPPKGGYVGHTAEPLGGDLLAEDGSKIGA